MTSKCGAFHHRNYTDRKAKLRKTPCTRYARGLHQCSVPNVGGELFEEDGSIHKQMRIVLSTDPPKYIPEPKRNFGLKLRVEVNFVYYKGIEDR